MRKSLLTPLIIEIALIFNLLPSSYAYVLPYIPKAQVNQVNIIKSSKKILNFSKQVRGNKLDLSRQQLVDIDMPAVITFLEDHPKITALDLSFNNNLTGAGVDPLAAVASLTELSLARDSKLENSLGLTAKDMPAFAKNKTLKVLNLDMNSIGDKGALFLAKNTTLKKLDVSSNDLTDEGAIALLQNNNLTDLSLWANWTLGIKTAKAIAQNQSITKLNLEQTSITDEGAMLIAKNTHLISINLSLTNVTDIGTAALAHNNNLKKLQLWGNHVGTEGAKALATSQSLQVLSLDAKGLIGPITKTIGDEGAIALAHNTSLHHLILGHENITSIGAAELAKNSSLQSLDLIGNREINDSDAVLFAASPAHFISLGFSATSLTDKGAMALASIKGLKMLDLQFNHVSDAGAIAISSNTSLRELALAFDEIHDDGAIALAQMKSLRLLFIPFNFIGIVGSGALQNNKYIREIYVDPQRTATGDLPAVEEIIRKSYCYRTDSAIVCNRENVL